MNDTPKEPERRLQIHAGNRPVGIIPTRYAEVVKMAQGILESGLVPKGDDLAKITVKILYGLEIGLPPMQAIQSIYVVNNRPTLFGDVGIALIRGSGLLIGMREWFSGTPYEDDFTAHVELKRGFGMITEHQAEFTFSVDDAKTAKIWQKRGQQGQDTPWITHPKRMLQWRARWFGFHDMFADVLRGMRGYEEVEEQERQEPEAPQSSGLAGRLQAVDATVIDEQAIGRELAGIMDSADPTGELNKLGEHGGYWVATQVPTGQENAPTVTVGPLETTVDEVEEAEKGNLHAEEIEWIADFKRQLKKAKTPLEVAAIESVARQVVEQSHFGNVARLEISELIEKRKEQLA